MPHAELDHVLFGVPNLAEGMTLVQTRLGITPVQGGRHPGVGTHNALLSLGPRAYLEIIAPDPSQNVRDQDLPYGLAGLQKPRIITWAVRPADWQAHARQTQQLGLTSRLREGTRTRPDKVQLRWRSMQLVPPVTADRQDLTGLIPFAIEWQSAPHPATSAPGDLRLEALTLLHPQPHTLSSVVDALELPCDVDFAPKARMAARIQLEPGRTVTLA